MNYLLRRIVSAPALEELSDGKANKEVEYVFYGRVVNLEELKKTSFVEHHEQYEIKIPKTDKNAVGGKFRIRKTVKNGETEYVLTTKTKAGAGTNIEVPIPTTEDNFNQFKAMAEGGMIKDRYSFPIEGTDLIWEVDMFLKPDGSYHEWCKIDLEVNDLNTPIPAFPIALSDLITNQDGKRTEAEEAKVRSLYEYEFITRNPGRDEARVAEPAQPVATTTPAADQTAAASVAAPPAPADKDQKEPAAV